ncbi:hypothetical protein U1Q18_033751 [Sarracenia purpurea var. burkii]
MANTRQTKLLFLFFTIIGAALVVQGSKSHVPVPHLKFSISPLSESLQGVGDGGDRMMKKNSRRLMIGSTAPTCTYNECRGCKYKCRAEQVPVEGNDPINSAYHYKCVCHRQ